MTDIVEVLLDFNEPLSSVARQRAAIAIDRNRAELIALRRAVDPFLSKDDGTNLIPDHVRVSNMLERKNAAIAELRTALTAMIPCCAAGADCKGAYINAKRLLKEPQCPKTDV